jgi:hypothetical protein
MCPFPCRRLGGALILVRIIPSANGTSTIRQPLGR